MPQITRRPGTRHAPGKTLLSGAETIAIDSIGLIPEAERGTKVVANTYGNRVARSVGKYAGIRGNRKATLYGIEAVAQRKGASRLISGAFGLGDNSVQGRISTGLTIEVFVPGLGTLAAGASIVNCVFKTGAKSP